MPPSSFSPRNRRPTDGWPLGRVALIGALAVGAVVRFVSHPPNDLLASPFEQGAQPDSATSVTALPGAFGLSGEVRLQLRMPGERFDFPVQLSGASDQTEYQWIRADDSI